MFLFKVLSHSLHLEELARKVASELENELREIIEEEDRVVLCCYHSPESTRDLVTTFISTYIGGIQIRNK
jgi:ABC-type sulfate/molybdate transport systems ATPase subunit